MGAVGQTGNSIAVATVACLLGAGLAIGPAKAADLGGDCCADLEERVAELEATTVRKGNRKINVTLSGLVNEMVMYWDDGVNSDVYVVENSNSDNKFLFTGSATIRPGLTAGSLIEIELSSAEADDVDARIDGADNENRDGFLELAKASFNLKHDQLGRLTLGRDSTAIDDILLLDLSQNPVAGAADQPGGAFNLVRPHGTSGCNGAACRTSLEWDVIAPDLDTDYSDLIRYDSPSLFGFVISAAWGEDDVADLAIRYKKQWNSVRFVAGVGYQWFTDETEQTINFDAQGPVISLATIDCPDGLMQAACVAERADEETLEGSASVMHDPSGVYITAAGARQSYGKNNGITELRATVFTAPVTGREPEPADMWYVQTGVKRRWLLPGLGATTLYGEYQKFNGWAVRQSGETLGLTEEDADGNDILISEITGTSAELWGLGIVQDIDPAAMKLYLGFRAWNPELQAIQTDDQFNVTFDGEVPLEDFYIVAAGGQINF